LASVDGAAVGVGVTVGEGAVVDFGVIDADPTTSIDPRISGWKMQRKAYVPVVKNVCM
jgi:tetrahydrodipicolinate N-succinyltransferase